MRDRNGNQIKVPGPFHSVSEMKRANVNGGYHFFDEDTMRFFRSKIESPPIHGRLLITSEKAPHGPRLYSIIAVQDEGETLRVGEFQQFTSWDEAREFITEELTRDK